METTIVRAPSAPLLTNWRKLFGNIRIGRVASPLAVLVLWQFSSCLGLIPARILASPLTIGATFCSLLLSGELPGDLLVSLGRVAAGAAIGITAGAAFALFSGLSRRGEEIVDPLMQMLRAIPFLGAVPLLILWFGIGETPKIILVALGAAFPVYLNLFGGIRAADPKLIEAGRVFGLDRAALVRDIIVPSALPSALVGVRYGLGVAWLSLVVGEQIGADRGIGYMILNARDFLRTDIIVVGLLVYALLGLGTDALVRVCERRALAWRPSFLRSIR
ncbi:MAG TPA: ABC transporter permease [Candidatus Baltobacteraceae bacterium]